MKQHCTLQTAAHGAKSAARDKRHATPSRTRQPMTRSLFTAVIAACSFVLLDANVVFAQVTRGDGLYVSWWKLLILLPFVWIWVRGSDFVNVDTQVNGNVTEMPQEVWTPIVVFTFMVLFFVSLLMPNFIVCVSICAVASLAPILTYVFIRNPKVEPEAKVLTPAHLSKWFSNLGRRGRTAPVVAEKKLPYEQGAPVDFQPIGAEGGQQLIRARQDVDAYLAVKELVAELVDRGADRAMFDYTAEQVAVRYDVDGVWHPLEPRDRETGDAMLASFKALCGMNPADRRGRQKGRFKMKYNGGKYEGNIQSQGTQTGERAVVTIDYGDKYNTLEEIGMRDKLREAYTQAIRAPAGLILVSAMPTGGLSTLWTVTMKGTDRLTRDFICFMDKGKLEPEVENLTVMEYDLAAGQTPDQLIPQALLKEPDVLVAPEPPNGQTVAMLSKHVLEQQQLGFISVRAKESVEALLRILMLKAPPAEFAKAISCVVNVRLIRTLCENCKVAYEPSPQDLQRLGIPPGRVQYLYTEYQPPPPDSEEKPQPPCEKCGGIGYRGRTGLFEVLLINDTIRQVLVKQPKLEVLRQAAKQAGCRTIQEEGILLLAQGKTSLNELRRVLKG